MSKSISGLVPAGHNLLCEGASTRLERAPKAHRLADFADRRPADVLDDQAKHQRRFCNASVRFARANNKLISSLYHPRQPTLYIMKLDAK